MKFLAAIALFAGLAFAETENEITRCARERFGVLANPTDCSKYVMCVSGFPVPITCPRGMGFDERIKICSPFSKCKHVNPVVVEEPKVDTFKCPGKGVFGDLDDCQKFHVCTGEDNSHLFDCDEGEGFDVKTRECKQREFANCLKKEDTEAEMSKTVDDFKCPTEFGYYPHPDCRKFIFCSCNFPNINTCPDGTQWNQQAKVCDHMTTKCFMQKNID